MDKGGSVGEGGCCDGRVCVCVGGREGVEGGRKWKESLLCSALQYKPGWGEGGRLASAGLAETLDSLTTPGWACPSRRITSHARLHSLHIYAIIPLREGICT